MEPQDKTFDKNLQRDALATESTRYQEDANFYVRHCGITFINMGASDVLVNNEMPLPPGGGTITVDAKRGEVFEQRYIIKFGAVNQTVLNAGFPPRDVRVSYNKPSTERFNQTQ